MSSMEEKKETPGAQKPKGRERRHSCQQCDKSFKTSGHLKRHLHIHTGEKPYSCEECGKTFSTSDALKSHQRIHTGEKPNSCEECGTTFSTSDALKSHQVFILEKNRTAVKSVGQLSVNQVISNYINYSYWRKTVQL
ncbi:zinc finger protein 431-like [Gymnodraco acuticeps]|uniref:Zinc finger protein 431-like n=1 Tax=Gymnodraco acuticeps TaxID=8218 RepID=A0A6P8VYC1_GYMAC|nr:zinc finger protein 431-like [Gymnodraco acuticeps]